MIVLTKFFLKSELKTLKNKVGLSDVFEGVKRIDKDLGISIKVSCNFQNLRFFKVRVGKLVKARMIVFLRIDSSKYVPIVLRLKKDKVFGMNMSMNNKVLADLLKANFEKIIEDLEKGDFEEFDLKDL